MTTQLSSYLELSDLDKRSYFHPFTSIADHERTGPWVIQSGSGITIKDAEGQEYLDATSIGILLNSELYKLDHLSMGIDH